MIYITGDTHGGFQRFGSKYFPQQTQMGRNDYMIIWGDFGGLWDGGQKDQHWLDWLDEKSFTTCLLYTSLQTKSPIHFCSVMTACQISPLSTTAK